MDYTQFEKLLTNEKIIQTTLSDSPSNLYDGATSYGSKRANIVDNYGLSKKLKAVYETYLDLLNKMNILKMDVIPKVSENIEGIINSVKT